MFKNLSLFLCLALLCLNSGLKTNEDKIAVSVAYTNSSENEEKLLKLKTENIDYDDSLYNLIIRVAEIFSRDRDLVFVKIKSIKIKSMNPSDYIITLGILTKDGYYDDRPFLLHPTDRSFYRIKNHHPNEESLSFALNIYNSIKDETDLSRDAYFDRITKMLNAWTYLRPELVPLSKQGPSKKSKWFIPKLFIS